MLSTTKMVMSPKVISGGLEKETLIKRMVILERKGTSCILLRVGSYADGTARTELHHWENVKIAHFRQKPFTVERPKLGRKCKQQINYRE